jgi:uncharacterized ferritin-like protein (DUF455 family)
MAPEHLSPLPHEPEELRAWALACLIETDAVIKAQRVRARLHPGLLDAACCQWPEAMQQQVPGRPARPVLVPPQLVPQRTAMSPEGRAALLHAVAHIEFNAINLALDAIWRFPSMPSDYYSDWFRVTREEALHFLLLSDHLAGLGVQYGDLPAHDGLWQMARRTQADVLARMALVPRTLEARGLDATPPMRRKFVAAGDTVAAGILDIILRDEIGHVAVGNRWYRYLCQQRGLDPLAEYPQLVKRYQAPRLKPPFNLEARLAAGFDQLEIEALEQVAAPPP